MKDFNDKLIQFDLNSIIEIYTDATPETIDIFIKIDGVLYRYPLKNDQGFQDPYQNESYAVLKALEILDPNSKAVLHCDHKGLVDRLNRPYPRTNDNQDNEIKIRSIIKSKNLKMTFKWICGKTNPADILKYIPEHYRKKPYT